MNPIQLPLPFPGLWQPIADVRARDVVASDAHLHSATGAALWCSKVGIWYAALLDGRFDQRVCPSGYTVRSFTMVKGYSGWGVCVDIEADGRETLTTAYWDSSRRKALHGWRFLARNDLLEWKIKRK